jgi:hypothetical protein
MAKFEPFEKYAEKYDLGKLAIMIYFSGIEMIFF